MHIRLAIVVFALSLHACNSDEKRTSSITSTDSSSITVPGDKPNDENNTGNGTDTPTTATPTPGTDTVTTPVPPMSMADKALLGRHNFTLQWVGWNNPGIVVIEKGKDGWYTIKGRQEGSSGYVLIDGKLRPVFENVEDAVEELEFDGRIESKTQSVNGNEACTRKGTQKFLSTKGRKYWRLQQMINCDSTTTDYIDIYFK